MMDKVNIVFDGRFKLAEGPWWDDLSGDLFWIDIPAGDLYRLRPGQERPSRIHVGGPVGSVAPRAGGGFVLARREGFYLLDPGVADPRLVARVARTPSDPILNDGKCDSTGRFWAGSAQVGADGAAGCLYRLDPDRTLVRVLEGIRMSNGLDWSPDGRRFYYVDTATRRIDVFDVDMESGEISGRRPFATIAPDDGVPDGLTVDAEGGVWVALWGGWSVRRYAPDGTTVGSVRLPAANVTSCTFGGDGLSELFVTTATQGLAADELDAQPHAGAIFSVRVGVRGLPTRRFAG